MLIKKLGSNSKEMISNYPAEELVITKNQQDFIKETSCQINLIFFFDSVSKLEYQWNVVSHDLFVDMAERCRVNDRILELRILKYIVE